MSDLEYQKLPLLVRRSEGGEESLQAVLLWKILALRMCR